MLKVKNLSCHLNEILVLNKIDFSISKGEYAVIVGVNGVGKTTLLRCLNRVIDNWSGEILLNDLPIRKISRKRLAQKIAFVQQMPQVIFSLSVRQFVEQGRYPHLKPFSPISEKDNRTVDQALKLLNIDFLADRLLETLSGGERQKVYLAAALVQEPEILLLDEPTTFLDYRHQKEISEFLKYINLKNQTTIIEISHDLNHAAINAKRIIALANGKIAFNGLPEDFMQKDILQNIFLTEMQLVQHPRQNLAMIIPYS